MGGRPVIALKRNKVIFNGGLPFEIKGERQRKLMKILDVQVKIKIFKVENRRWKEIKFGLNVYPSNMKFGE